MPRSRACDGSPNLTVVKAKRHKGGWDGIGWDGMGVCPTPYRQALMCHHPRGQLHSVVLTFVFRVVAGKGDVVSGAQGTGGSVCFEVSVHAMAFMCLKQCSTAALPPPPPNTHTWGGAGVASTGHSAKPVQNTAQRRAARHRATSGPDWRAHALHSHTSGHVTVRLMPHPPQAGHQTKYVSDGSLQQENRHEVRCNGRLHRGADPQGTARHRGSKQLFRITSAL